MTYLDFAKRGGFNRWVVESWGRGETTPPAATIARIDELTKLIESEQGIKRPRGVVFADWINLAA